MSRISLIINLTTAPNSDCYYKIVSLGRIYTKFFDEYVSDIHGAWNMTRNIKDKL